MRRISKAGYLVAIISVLISTLACPPDDSNGGDNSHAFRPAPGIQDGLLVFEAYSDYFYEYRQAQATANNCTPPNCNFPIPCPTSGPDSVACQILHPNPVPASPPNPIDPIPLDITPLVSPTSGTVVVPSHLSDLLQKDFQAILMRVPAVHSNTVKGWTLNIAPCSSAGQVLWAGHVAKAGQPGGTICLSPLIIRAVVIDLAAAPSASLFRLLVQHDSTNPFGFDGDSKALIRNYASKEHIAMTEVDLQALAGVIDNSVAGLGTALPPLKMSLDYLIAREIVQVYSPSADENAIAAAASALVATSPNVPDLTAISTTLLPAAIGTTGATNWGVTSVGDGQRVLAAINSLGIAHAGATHGGHAVLARMQVAMSEIKRLAAVTNSWPDITVLFLRSNRLSADLNLCAHAPEQCEEDQHHVPVARSLSPIILHREFEQGRRNTVREM